MSQQGLIQNIVFFDGVCNLCNNSVDFLMKIDKKKTLKFASLQSDFAKEKLQHFEAKFSTENSILFLQNENLYSQSTAVAMLLKQVGGGWKMVASMILFFPISIRDTIYKFVAKHRYQWFGKRNVCRVPNENEK